MAARAGPVCASAKEFTEGCCLRPLMEECGVCVHREWLCVALLRQIQVITAYRFHLCTMYQVASKDIAEKIELVLNLNRVS